LALGCDWLVLGWASLGLPTYKGSGPRGHLLVLGWGLGCSIRFWGLSLARLAYLYGVGGLGCLMDHGRGYIWLSGVI